MRFSNGSSQGEQCMMSLMFDLIILVICIWCEEKTGTEGKIAGGDEGVKFSIFHFPYAG